MSRHIWHSAVQPKQVVYGKGSHYNILQVTDSGGRSPRSRRSHMSKWIIWEANAHLRTLQHVSTSCFPDLGGHVLASLLDESASQCILTAISCEALYIAAAKTNVYPILATFSTWCTCVTPGELAPAPATLRRWRGKCDVRNDFQSFQRIFTAIYFNLL